jgi:hypothetical protein
MPIISNENPALIQQKPFKNQCKIGFHPEKFQNSRNSRATQKCEEL